MEKSARAGNRTRVEASTTPHDNRYTTRAVDLASDNRYLSPARGVGQGQLWRREKLLLKQRGNKRKKKP
tara:strand:- start:298 stop:504 length:207 start_codon:yes stop_codon:yes gene_type:complete